jgi:hypothetical protein
MLEEFLGKNYIYFVTFLALFGIQFSIQPKRSFYTSNSEGRHGKTCGGIVHFSLVVNPVSVTPSFLGSLFHSSRESSIALTDIIIMPRIIIILLFLQDTPSEEESGELVVSA